MSLWGINIGGFHKECLLEAFAKLLGQGSTGTMVFLRCLDAEAIAAVIDPGEADNPKASTDLKEWRIYGVTSEQHLLRTADAVPQLPYITADQAVDLRERKEGSILLLVDRKAAGAGMDGIYSAVREIGERELFKEAKEQARRHLSPTLRRFGENAVRRATRVGRTNPISPLREFDFWASVAADQASLPQQIARLGLWPIASLRADTQQASDSELDVAAQLVERLLLASGPSQTIPVLVESLLLPTGAEREHKDLEEFLRVTEGQRWSDRILELHDRPALWLGNLIPGFTRAELRTLQLVSWRGTNNSPLRWSGLTAGPDNELTFLVAENEDDRSKSKLEIRWKTEPAELPAGAVQYEVSVLTANNVVMATRSIPHSASKSHQRCVFTGDDLDDLDEQGKWEAKVRIQPLIANIKGFETVEFILTFGDVVAPKKESIGHRVRALVEEAIQEEDQDNFTTTTRNRASEDTRRFVTHAVVTKRSGRVFRPPLLRIIEEDWRNNGYAIGRWVVKVRTDGSAATQPIFVPIEMNLASQVDLRKRLEDCSRRLAQKAMDRCGFVGMIYRSNETADDYVNAWTAGLETAEPALALFGTLAMESLDGRSLGLIVLPFHPLRVAWHQGYDELAWHARYKENLRPKSVVQSLRSLDGSDMPLFLPGFKPGDSFVFGDTLGFYAVGMTRHDESEPQAVVAQMARCLSSGASGAVSADERNEVAPSVGASTSMAVGREIAKYSILHPAYSTLQIAALRPGDGLTVARALGNALDLRTRRNQDDTLEEAGGDEKLNLGFRLDLLPSADVMDQRVVGRFLGEITERRRTGAGIISDKDRWMLETYRLAATEPPRLRWTRGEQEEPTNTNHISVAFDTFQAQVVTGIAGPVQAITNSSNQLMLPDESRPIEVFGLLPSVVRRFSTYPIPNWTMYIAPQTDGEKHPASRMLTERIQRLHAILQRLTADQIADARSASSPMIVPVLRTEVSSDKAEALQRLHERSDWVITVDRNAGIEYFDAPSENPSVYDTYVIDCVPERQDLSSQQLVTSTSNMDEVMRLLDRTILEMGLSCSPPNCRRLLHHLKALSGRLAMRLASQRQGRSAPIRGELIALSLLFAECAAEARDILFPSLKDGFFVPLDDVHDLLLLNDKASGSTEAPEHLDDAHDDDGTDPLDRNNLRADLLYITHPNQRRAVLQFNVIEVKYRRLLRSAVNPSLQEHIGSQTWATRQRIKSLYFDPGLTQTQRAVRRKRLARTLQFYADKAKRHTLPEETHHKISSAIDRLFRSETDWLEPYEDQGFVFCPEHNGPAQEIGSSKQTKIVLFGPQDMSSLASLQHATPVAHDNADAAPPQATVVAEDSDLEGSTEVPKLIDGLTQRTIDEPQDIMAPPVRSEREDVEIALGTSIPGNNKVTWTMSIRGNPHLILVGQPGMGKTTCILRLCEQFIEQGVVPIVFSFHHDIEEQLSATFPSLRLVDIENGLGFNPMRVTTATPHGWIDNVGMLRDMFAGLFPDFGEIQLNEIREAIRQSYTELGYGLGELHAAMEFSTPEFDRFFAILQSKAKPNAGIKARLGELNDYGFFRTDETQESLLASGVPSIVRLYTTQNEMVQNATAAFVLLSLYKQMFLRSTQSRITHAIIFDEAHRASHLKLIPVMAKESRKYGLACVLASQEAKDFSSSLFGAIANYLVLRVTEVDANALARNIVASNEASALSTRLKTLERYHAMFSTEGRRPVFLALGNSS